ALYVFFTSYLFSVELSFYFDKLLRQARSTLFPYTTLFRSMHPSRPNTLFMQKHWDVMRSDNAGDSWTEVRITGIVAAHHVPMFLDRKSTRLNSSHSQISYAVFCLKKKNHNLT